MQSGFRHKTNNLIRNISNWPLYFTRKLRSGFSPLTFTTSGYPVKVEVPNKYLLAIFKEMYMTDFYQFEKMVAALPEKPVVIDIGANVGYFALLLLSKKPQTTLLAYEPVKINYQQLERHQHINPALKDKFHIFNMAVTGTYYEYIDIYLESDENHSAIASINSSFDSKNNNSIKVPALTLEQVITNNGLDMVDLVKLDCEGSEYPIIYETPVAVWRKINGLVIEVHQLDNEKQHLHYLENYLNQLGYHTTHQKADNDCYLLTASRIGPTT